MPSNSTAIADESGDYDDWIELFNSSANAYDLAGHYFSDDGNNLQKWLIPAGSPNLTTVPANGYLILWADQEILDGANHLGFKLSSAGETVYLTATDGQTIIDSLPFGSILSDNSYGRFPDGFNAFETFFPSSPEASNNQNLPLAPEPIFSVESGMLTAATSITLSSSIPGADIYYSLDGSEPDINSTLYTGPITISQTAVLRARVIANGYVPSNVESKAYGFNLSNGTPTVFITTDPFNLWDDQFGIYVEGTNGAPSGCGGGLDNYYQDWQKPGHAVYLDKDRNVVFDKNIEVEISGGCTRHYAKKSMNFKFINNEDGNEVTYPFFEERGERTYEGLKLRNFGNWSWTTRIDDAMLHRIMEENTNISVQSSELVTVYLNGEYWGLYNLRDRTNTGYIRTHFPKIDDDNIDLIKNPLSIYRQDVKRGDTMAYHDLTQFMINNDMAIDVNYQYAKSQLNFNPFMDQHLWRVYLNAADWLGNNMMVWRTRDAKGKFDFVSFDLDSWLADPTRMSFVYLVYEHPNTPWKFQEPGATPIKRMMNNPDYRNEFAQRMKTYMHTVWEPSFVETYYNEFRTQFLNELPADQARWYGDHSHSDWRDTVRLTIPEAAGEMDSVLNFFEKRPAVILPYVNNLWFGNVDSFDLTLNHTGNGSIALHSNFTDVPNGFTANYWSDIPIQIHAVADPGYRFSHWVETGSTDATIFQSFNSNTTRTAVFVPALDIVINEIHYNPTGSNEDTEFIEIYNPDTEAKSLRAYKFSEGICFTFPEDAIIGPGEYQIIARDRSLYSGNSYTVYEWDYTGLSNGGELLQIVNPVGKIIDEVDYSDDLPWRIEADGDGFSLALLNISLDNSLASSWKIQPGEILTPGAANIFCDIFEVNTSILQPITCYLQNNALIMADVSGGNSAYTYQWSNNANNNDIATGFYVGTHTVTVSDEAGCSATESFTLTQPAPISYTYTANDVSYLNANDGSISLNANGGVAPLTYSWSNGATTASINNLSPGLYTCTITDANNCTKIFSVNIEGVDCSNVNANVTILQHVSCNSGSNGAAYVSVTGIVAPVSYSWSNGSSSSSINGLSAGTYSATITDGVGCSETKSININQPVALQINETINHESSAGANDGSIIGSVSGGTAPYTYIWSNGASAPSINNLAPGNYNLTIFDSNNCVVSKSFTINAGSNPCSMPANIVASNITDNSMTLIWDQNNSANNYTVQYRAEGNNNWNTFNSNFSFAILSNLQSCTNYEIRIQAACSNASSAYSAIQSFSTNGCNMVCDRVLGLYEQNITTQSVILVWDLYAGADYTLFYRSQNGGTWNTYDTSYPLAILFSLNSCTSYEWYVVVHCDNGLSGDPSPISNFTTQGSGCNNRDEENISPEIMDSKISIYPNPVSDKIFFKGIMEAKPFDLSIFNAQGKLLARSNNSDFFNDGYHVADLPNGLYILRLHFDGREDEHFSFVKE